MSTRGVVPSSTIYALECQNHLVSHTWQHIRTTNPDKRKTEFLLGNHIVKLSHIETEQLLEVFLKLMLQQKFTKTLENNQTLVGKSLPVAC
jgi:hypothetical protein